MSITSHRSPGCGYVATAYLPGRCLRVCGVPPKFETDELIRAARLEAEEKVKAWRDWSIRRGS